MRFGFAGGDFKSISVQVSDQRTANLWPRIPQAAARGTVILFRTPGLKRMYSGLGGDAPGRGQFSLNDQIFSVNGEELTAIFDTYTTSLGTGITNDQKPVQYASNQDILFFRSAGKGWVTGGGSGLRQIVDPDFPTDVIDVAYLNGYFFALTKTAIFWSAVEDPETWDALDFIEVLASANSLIGMIVDHQQLLVFGNQIAQPFALSPGDPVIVPIEGSIIEQGLAGVDGKCKIDNSVFFVNKDERGQGVFSRLQGFDPIALPNQDDVSAAVQRYGDISDVIVEAFQMDNQPVVQWTFPSARVDGPNSPATGATWRFGVNTGLWHEAPRWNNGSEEAALWQHHSFAFNKHVVTSRVDGTVYELTMDALDDDGATIRRVRRAPHLFDPDSNKNKFYGLFELIIAPGIGNDAFPDPQASLKWSNNGGKTWSAARLRGAGAAGKYGTRLQWYRLGRARSSRTFEVVLTDSVDWVIMDATVDMK